MMHFIYKWLNKDRFVTCKWRFDSLWASICASTSARRAAAAAFFASFFLPAGAFPFPFPPFALSFPFALPFPLPPLAPFFFFLSGEESLR
jgi:hypothetical protein